MKKTFERNEDCATVFLKWTDFSLDIMIGQSAAAQNVTWPRYHTRDINKWTRSFPIPDTLKLPTLSNMTIDPIVLKTL